MILIMGKSLTPFKLRQVSESERNADNNAAREGLPESQLVCFAVKVIALRLDKKGKMVWSELSWSVQKIEIVIKRRGIKSRVYGH